MTDEMRHFYKRYVDAANARDFPIIAGLIHDEVAINGTLLRRDDVLASLKDHVGAVPDLVWTIENIVIEGDHIAARLRNAGTPRRTWLGLEPNGASVIFSEFAHYKVREGRFCEMWFLMDSASVARQLAA